MQGATCNNEDTPATFLEEEGLLILNGTRRWHGGHDGGARREGALEGWVTIKEQQAKKPVQKANNLLNLGK